MRFVTIFLTITLSLPFIGLFLYMIFYPRESALFGERWKFKNADLEPSEEAMKYEKRAGIIGLIIVGMFVFLFLFFT